ncbi:MAG: hypothetical protein MUC28_00740 [Planctomycetes bacterium]|nr:hypothetical protein [Planctomycetota bacterium]
MIFSLALLSASSGLLGGAVRAQDQSDAIAVRVVPNLEHYSALRWYREKNLTGSPQSLTVGGYEAVRDERTVIVNAANILGNNLYTNIYIISYNEEAGKATGDIFSQILKHWKFNVNLVDYGFCRETALKKGQSIFCLLDEDCPIGDKCDSMKARVVRDTKRLADLAETRHWLDGYKNRGNYPKLSAGTYLPNKTLSVWPSWRETLSRELKTTLPVDPVNKLGACAGYNELTCWNENNKNFAALYPDLPDESLAYAYYTDTDGGIFNLCAVFESGYVISGVSISGFCAEVCLDFDGDGYCRPVCGACTLDCNDTDPAIQSPEAEICSGGVDEDCDGLADCHDGDCSASPFCAGWPLPPPVTECGNGVVEAGEICESGHPITPCPTACDDGNACTNDNLINPGTCNDYCEFLSITPCCGNGLIEAGETCDNGPGSTLPCPPTCNDGNNCTDDSMSGSAAACTVLCTNTAINTCSLTINDFCCPLVCNSSNDMNCAAVCGNSACEAGETCSTCPADCGACPPACGDGVCNGTETCSTCPADCGACPPACGDGVCNGTETCTTCPADCGACLCIFTLTFPCTFP